MKKSFTSYQEIKQITLFVSTVFGYSRLCWFQISQEERSKVWEMYLKLLHTAIMSKWSSLWNLIKCKNLVYIFYSGSSNYVMGQGIGKLLALWFISLFHHLQLFAIFSEAQPMSYWLQDMKTTEVSWHSSSCSFSPFGTNMSLPDWLVKVNTGEG